MKRGAAGRARSRGPRPAPQSSTAEHWPVAPQEPAQGRRRTNGAGCREMKCSRCGQAEFLPRQQNAITLSRSEVHKAFADCFIGSHGGWARGGFVGCRPGWPAVAGAGCGRGARQRERPAATDELDRRRRSSENDGSAWNKGAPSRPQRQRDGAQSCQLRRVQGQSFPEATRAPGVKQRNGFRPEYRESDKLDFLTRWCIYSLKPERSSSV